MKRYSQIAIIIGCLLICACLLSACALPKANPNPNNVFGIDQNINMNNIDKYLGREDSVYIDLRMINDPAEYEDIGGESDLTTAIKGFKCVPYPYLATLQDLPVEGAYSGLSLFTVDWNEDGSINSVTANYEESYQVLYDMFPKDKNIFLCCGGGGYAGMVRSLLTYLGWNAEHLYNVGAVWTYTGNNAYELIVSDRENPFIASWRIDYAFIDFSLLHPLG